MITRREVLRAAAAGLGVSVLSAQSSSNSFAADSPDDPRLDMLASQGLRDFEARVQVVSADQTELAKINRDFGMAYRLKNLTMRYKEPNKLRMEGPIGSIVINGSLRQFKVPAIKLSKTDELGESPGKRYTLMDIGMLTAGSLSAVQGRYLRDENLGGTPTRQFEVTYRGDNSLRYLVWVDPRTHLIVKREWFDGTGKRKATFLYQQPQQIASDLWAPTRVEIRNASDALAAVTAYSDLKVNQGLDDSLFKIG